MIKTTYTCDRCGAVQDTYDQMWRVSVSCKSFPVYNDQDCEPRRGGDWCRKCVNEFQLLGAPVAKKDVPSVPSLTLEDMVREIVNVELQNKGLA